MQREMFSLFKKEGEVAWMSLGVIQRLVDAGSNMQMHLKHCLALLFSWFYSTTLLSPGPCMICCIVQHHVNKHSTVAK